MNSTAIPTILHTRTNTMTDKFVNWMDQVGDLYKQWADQQHNFFRSIVGGARSFSVGGTPTADAASDVNGSPRRAQALWQSSMEQRISLAKQAMPQPGVTGARYDGRSKGIRGVTRLARIQECKFRPPCTLSVLRFSIFRAITKCFGMRLLKHMHTLW